MVQVSVIVATYHPNLEKLIKTLKGALVQKEVTFELILCDDGSSENHFEKAEMLFAEKDFTSYRLVANKENRGTVKNCISGLNAATGEYVFFTSPGDILFDPYVLRDFYAFAEAHQAKMCFGNAVHYCFEDDHTIITTPHTRPQNPEYYAPGQRLSDMKRRFFQWHFVIGAAYFRRREFAAAYFDRIQDCSIFTEDSTSAAFALADGIPLCYYDRNMVWYEDGSGISTGENNGWKPALLNDLRKTVDKLYKRYPRDADIGLLWADLCIDNRRLRPLHKLLHHPVTWLRRRLRKEEVVPAKRLSWTDEDIQRLENL